MFFDITDITYSALSPPHVFTQDLSLFSGWLFDYQRNFEGWKEAVYTLPATNIAPEHGWLEDDRFLLGWRNLTGAIAVSFRECSLLAYPIQGVYDKRFFQMDGSTTKKCMQSPSTPPTKQGLDYDC